MKDDIRTVPSIGKLMDTTVLSNGGADHGGRPSPTAACVIGTPDNLFSKTWENSCPEDNTPV